MSHANAPYLFIGCNCDVGGSYSQICGKYTGQCNCRPNVGGRACDRYSTTIAHLIKFILIYNLYFHVCFTGRYQSITMLTCSNCFPKSKMAAHQRIHQYALGTVNRSFQVILGEDMASFQIFRYYSI